MVNIEKVEENNNEPEKTMGPWGCEAFLRIF